MTNFGQLLRQTPALISSAIDYYRYEPLQPSWDLKIHLIFHFIKNMAGSSTKQTIEQRQKEGSVATKVINKSVQVDVLSLPNTLREKTASYIDKILEDYNNVILDDWRNTNLGNGLNCEWVYVKDDNNNNNGNGNDLNQKKKHEKVILFLHGGAYCLFSAAYYREKTSRLAVSTNARILAIDYRLAPQNQFPAALHDAITAYNYLVDPPKDADFEPIDPKKIVIMGDSAGGGLAIATALALRDLKLPLPGGIVTWSPWVDLASTMPSTLDPKFHKTDFIGFLTEKGHNHKMSPAWKEFEQKANELSEKIKKTQSDSNNKKQKFWHDSFDRDGRMLFYASNEGLAIPYVSPLFAESLCDLPPILMQTGDGEVFRDENIYFAFKATNPEKYNLPYYNAEKFKKSPYKTPPKVIFEIYEEMFHVFQSIPGYASPELAFKRTGDFINQILEGKGPQESKYFHVTFKGEVIEGLSEEHYKVLEWKNVGIMDVKKKASAPT